MKILVCNVRNLQLGYVGSYGNDWLDTPALDRLAAEGVVFDQHYADCPAAEGARRSWMTGRYALPDPDKDPIPSKSPDLLQLLHEGGVATCLIREQSSLSRKSSVGWERVVPLAADLEALPAVVDGALDTLTSRPHWLLWLDLDTLVPPWVVPPQFHEPDDSDEGATPPLTHPSPGPLGDAGDAQRQGLQQGYAAAVRCLDFGVGGLWDTLERRELLDDLVVILTSDRGAVLGEHGIVGESRPWLHEELLHVPLVIRLPAAAEAGRRVGGVTQAVDLLPTLLAFQELPAEPAAHGHSLVPLLHGAAAVRDYACAGLRLGSACEWALRTPEWAFLLPLAGEPDHPPRPPQLYLKPDDRWEVNNVIQHHWELAENLERTLRGFVTASRRAGPLIPPALNAPDAGPESSNSLA